MDFISFHHLAPYFFLSDLGVMKNLSCSVLKFPNDRMESSLRSAPFRYILLRSGPFCSIHIKISKHPLLYFSPLPYVFSSFSMYFQVHLYIFQFQYHIKHIHHKHTHMPVRATLSKISKFQHKQQKKNQVLK